MCNQNVKKWQTLLIILLFKCEVEFSIVQMLSRLSIKLCGSGGLRSRGILCCMQVSLIVYVVQYNVISIGECTWTVMCDNVWIHVYVAMPIVVGAWCLVEILFE